MWGHGQDEHDTNFEKILKHAKEIGHKLNMDKCKFCMKEVTYVGHKITDKGLLPDDSKIAAIMKMPAPENKTELQGFLGMLNYLNKFIENYSEKPAPLRELLRNDNLWSWNKPQEVAFKKLKEEITNPPLLPIFRSREKSETYS